MPLFFYPYYLIAFLSPLWFDRLTMSGVHSGHPELVEGSPTKIE